MSQEDAYVDIIRISAKGISKQAAVAQMSLENPASTLHGVRPEIEDGYWVALFKRQATDVPGSMNPFPSVDHEQGSPEPITPQDGPPEPEGLGEEMGGPEDEASDSQDLHDILLDIKDLLMEVVGGNMGTSEVGGFRGGPDQGTDHTVNMDEGPVEDDQKDVLDPFGETDFKKAEDEGGKFASTAHRVYRDRGNDSLKDAREQLVKQAKTHPRYKNYQLTDMDVTPDGKQFVATLAPKPRQAKPRAKR